MSRPKFSSLEKVKKALNESIIQLEEASVDELTKNEQLQNFHALVDLTIIVQFSVGNHSLANTIPNPEEFQQFKNLAFHINNLELYQFPTLEYDYIQSLLRGDYLTQKHGTTKKQSIPKHIQSLKDGARNLKR